MNKELNAAEAVYGFVGWLTSREERTVMSAKDDCAPIAELIKRFCTENNLPEVSDQWPLNLIHPSGEVAVPNAVLAKWGTPAPVGAADSVQEDAACWQWLAEYLVGTRTDLDDEIVASETVNDLRKLVKAAIKQGATQ